MAIVVIVLIIALVTWLGYQSGRSKTDGSQTDDQRKRFPAHPVYRTADERRESYAQERNYRLALVSADTANWLDSYLAECESPAEEAFLRAIVSEYGLLPSKGMLTSPDLALQMQIDKGPYRVDFLGNDWLVIEIDGDEYHASPEQIERDAVRDKYLASRGYTVLRIAAKALFQQPKSAVASVRSALAVGRQQDATPQIQPQASEPSAPPPTSVLSAFSRGLEVVAEGAKRINEFADRQQAIQSANSVARMIFYEEKVSINSALEIAKSRLSVEKYMTDNPDQHEEMIGIREALRSALKDPDSKAAENVKVAIAKITKPTDHPNPEINEIIQRNHSALMEERAAYFATVREQMRQAEGRHSSLVREALMDFGHHTTWVELTGSGGQFVRMSPAPLLQGWRAPG